MLVPVVVRPAQADVEVGGWTFELVAGFHRVAAAAELGMNEIPVVIRAADTEAAAATENITRKQPNPYEPGGIALDASFGPLDDAIASGLGRFPALAAIVG
jgi:ParB-like chromosome segregation protein Spo0J